MAKNENLHDAKQAKMDDFYTYYDTIEAEANAYIEFNHDVFRGKTILLPCDDPEWSNFTKYFAANFERLGIKKLISTSYAPSELNRQISLFESESPQFDEHMHREHGKVFIMDHPIIQNGEYHWHDVDWYYLKGDGDFRSEEVTHLRDESDVIITNPPFSLFREFLEWVEPDKRLFSIIGNVNAITYKEVFPLIKNNTIWLGASIHSGDRKFNVPDSYPLNAAGCGVESNGRHYIKVKGVRWYTNIDHGLRHESMPLMTMQDNLIYNKKLRKTLMNKYGQDENNLHYEHYDNYDAIEVSQTDAIPSDYDGVMSVPITFLDKYCPDQFEILNANDFRKSAEVPTKSHGLIKDKEGSITLDKSEQSGNAIDRQTDRQHSTLTERSATVVYSYGSYDDMVARPIIHSIKTYRRIFICRKH